MKTAALGLPEVPGTGVKTGLWACFYWLGNLHSGLLFHSRICKANISPILTVQPWRGGEIKMQLFSTTRYSVLMVEVRFLLCKTVFLLRERNEFFIESGFMLSHDWKLLLVLGIQLFLHWSIYLHLLQGQITPGRMCRSESVSLPQ